MSTEKKSKAKKVPNPAKVAEAETVAPVELTIEERMDALAGQVSAAMQRIEEIHQWALSVDAVVAKNIPYIDAAALFAFHTLDKKGMIELPEEWTPGFAKEAQAKIADVVKLLQASMPTSEEGAVDAKENV